jgi:uncharacterized membrane protein HdeD (DUF308 family)
VLFIGAWALVHGIFEIIGAIQLRKEIDNDWMLILGGALSVLFGLIVLIARGAGALGLIWAIGTYCARGVARRPARTFTFCRRRRSVSARS